jgi:hypothetical protein
LINENLTFNSGPSGVDGISGLGASGTNIIVNNAFPRRMLGGINNATYYSTHSGDYYELTSPLHPISTSSTIHQLKDEFNRTK